MRFLRYELELEGVKENNLTKKDEKELLKYNNSIGEIYGLETVGVYEKSNNLCYVGRIMANTKQECKALLTILISELSKKYKKYNLIKIHKKMIAEGKII